MMHTDFADRFRGYSRVEWVLLFILLGVYLGPFVLIGVFFLTLPTETATIATSIVAILLSTISIWLSRGGQS